MKPETQLKWTLQINSTHKQPDNLILIPPIDYNVHANSS